MNILLIGSEGILGKDLQKLLSKKHKLRLIDFIDTKNKRNYIKLDLTKEINLNKIDSKVYDLAVILSFYKSQPNQFNKVESNVFIKKNNLILNNSLKISKLHKVKKIIYFSSAAIYSNNSVNEKISESFSKKPTSIYGKFKLKAEKKVLNFGKKNQINCLNLRLFNYFNEKGNILITNFKKQLKTKKIIINGDGNQKRDFLHINDISSAIEKIYISNIKSGNYNLCSSTPTTIKDLLNSLNFNKKKINYLTNIKTNNNLVGSNFKLKKFIKWKIAHNFNDFIAKL